LRTYEQVMLELFLDTILMIHGHALFSKRAETLENASETPSFYQNDLARRNTTDVTGG
jgi:hypothetical protein